MWHLKCFCSPRQLHLSCTDHMSALHKATSGVSCRARSLSSRPAVGRFVPQVKPRAVARVVKTQAALKALLWDCDGVILESEDLHRRAYNAVFAHFKVTVGGAPVVWSEEYYDLLSNTGTGVVPLHVSWPF